MRSSSHIPSNYSSGFTLVEFLITSIIAIILAAIAVPGFVDLIQQIRLSTVTDELYAAINLTRAEAIKRNGYVDLIAANGRWENGWHIKSAENDQIFMHEPLHKDFIINAKFSDGAQHVAYNGSGRSRTSESTYRAQTGHVAISLGKHTRLITVNFLGHARVCNPAKEKSCAITIDD